jgi:hypothetical protein
MPDALGRRLLETIAGGPPPDEPSLPPLLLPSPAIEPSAESTDRVPRAAPPTLETRTGGATSTATAPDRPARATPPAPPPEAIAPPPEAGAPPIEAAAPRSVERPPERPVERSSVPALAATEPPAAQRAPVEPATVEPAPAIASAAVAPPPAAVEPAPVAPTPEPAAAPRKPPPQLVAPEDNWATVRTPLLDPSEMGVSLGDEPESEATPLPIHAPGYDPLLPSLASAPQAPASGTIEVATEALELVRPPNIVVELAEPVAAPEPPLPRELAGLPPMPRAPASPGLWGAVQYLYPVGRAWWARRKAQAAIRDALVGDQRSLDQVLGELGRAAREERLDVAAVRDEMQELAAVEERRARDEAESQSTRERRAAEVERFTRLEKACDDAIVEQQATVAKSEQAQRDVAGRQREAQAELGRIDGELEAARRAIAAAEGRMGSAPPEQRGAVEAELATQRAREGEITPRREAAAARVAELDKPVEQAAQTLDEDQKELARRKRALAATVSERTAALDALDARLKQLHLAQNAAVAESSRRYVSIGTLLNLNRVERERFTPLYERIDALKSGVTEREALIARLDEERLGFDHAAAQKGVITVAAALGGLVVVAVLLLLLLG